MPHPPRLAVIGHPVSHSASPRMQQPALDTANIPVTYIAIDVEPGKVADCFAKMQQDGYFGCNVTVPHKLEAMSLCDHLTEEAIALGATNTIRFEADGTITGHNTDGLGIARAIYEEFSTPLAELRVLILGAGGGAGRAIATQCAREGSPAIYLSNRTIEKLHPLAAKLTAEFGAKNIHTLSTDPDQLTDAARHVDLIINATSVGLKTDDPSPLPATAILPHHLIYDAIYMPPVTSLINAATAIGAESANGSSMLIHQGALSFEFWLGTPPDISKMRSGFYSH